MQEAEQDQRNFELINEYYERDIQEREAREELLQEYRQWNAEEGNTQVDRLELSQRE
jgi:hypothetical protein